MVFIAMGVDYDTRAGQPVMVCPCLCFGVVVRFVLFRLPFVCVFRACYLGLYIYKFTVWFMKFLWMSSNRSARMYTCVCARAV